MSKKLPPIDGLTLSAFRKQIWIPAKAKFLGRQVCWLRKFSPYLSVIYNRILFFFNSGKWETNHSLARHLINYLDNNYKTADIKLADELFEPLSQTVSFSLCKRYRQLRSSKLSSLKGSENKAVPLFPEPKRIILLKSAEESEQKESEKEILQTKLNALRDLIKDYISETDQCLEKIKEILETKEEEYKGEKSSNLAIQTILENKLIYLKEMEISSNELIQVHLQLSEAQEYLDTHLVEGRSEIEDRIASEKVKFNKDLKSLTCKMEDFKNKELIKKQIL